MYPYEEVSRALPELYDLAETLHGFGPGGTLPPTLKHGPQGSSVGLLVASWPIELQQRLVDHMWTLEPVRRLFENVIECYINDIRVTLYGVNPKINPKEITG